MGVQKLPKMMGQGLAARPHPNSQPGSQVAPVPGIRHFPGYREELRLGQDVGLWVRITFSEVHSRAGAWTGDSGLHEMGSWVIVRDEEALGDAGLGCKAFWCPQDPDVHRKSISETNPHSLGYKCVLKCSDFGRIFILMCSSLSRLNCMVDLDKVFCQDYLPDVT